MALSSGQLGSFASAGAVNKSQDAYACLTIICKFIMKTMLETFELWINSNFNLNDSMLLELLPTFFDIIHNQSMSSKFSFLNEQFA